MQIKAGAELSEHPIFDENTVGMASHEASHSDYKHLFMALFVKKKLRATGRTTGGSSMSRLTG